MFTFRKLHLLELVHEALFKNIFRDGGHWAIPILTAVVNKASVDLTDQSSAALEAGEQFSEHQCVFFCSGVGAALQNILAHLKEFRHYQRLMSSFESLADLLDSNESHVEGIIQHQRKGV